MNLFDELLKGTRDYLETEKRSGVSYVHLSPEALSILQPQPLRSPAPQQRPFSRQGQAQSNTLPTTGYTFTPPPTAQITARPFVVGDMNIKIDLTHPLSPAEKQSKMDALREEVLKCQQCPHLVRSRKKIVFGVGNVNSPLLFIGEAPGADEDAEGEPFVGRAGQLLTKIIAAMGLSRGDVFIANILKCRPDTPGQTSGNRPPSPAEMKICFPWLARQIEIIQPKIIVALGATAVNGLLCQTSPIGKLRGHFQPFHGIQVMPTFHPSYLLRYANLSTKRLVWEDMLQVMEALQMPISEKQRGFFLPK